MKSRLIITILLILAIRASAYGATTTARVTFKPEAEVQPGGSVTVNDIAAIQAPADLAGRIARLSIARAPLAGQSRTLTAGYIKQMIARAEPKSTISVAGPDRIRVTGISSKVTGEELVEAARNFATESTPKDGREYEISVDPISREVIVPGGGAVSIRPEFISGSMRAGLNPVRLSVDVDDRGITTVYASVRVKVTATVLVATDQLQKDGELTTGNTIWDKRDISKFPNAIIDKGDKGYVARKTIKPGAVITSNDVALPAAIKQGDTISLVVRCGGVLLQTSAEAKQTGSVGDTIRVTSPVSTGEVRAKIIEPGLAEIKM